MSNIALGLILEKIASKDKDYRYMATSDLLHELEKGSFKTDGDMEKKICNIVLQQLDDTSSDISGLAVKCLGLLVHRVDKARVEDMLKTLCQNLISCKKEQQRDVACIGIKTAISEISGGELAAIAVKEATPQMIKGVDNKEATFDVCNECLDILHEVIRKFGFVMAAESQGGSAGMMDGLLSCLLPLMEEPRAGIRKRATHCIAAMSTFLNKELLERVCSAILGRLQDKSASTDISQAYLQTIGAVSRSIGFRFGPYLERAVPLVIEHCNLAGEEDYELREYCLQALESFVERCPQDLRMFLEPVFGMSLQYLSWDPNYDMDVDEQVDEDEDMDDDDDVSEDEYSDDEDMSWKVRRAAAKLLSAVSVNFPDLLEDIYPKASSELINRFREREENVKTDIFQTFNDIVKVVGSQSQRKDVAAAGPLRLLAADVPSVMKASSRQLKEKSVKTRVGVFLVLKELLNVIPSSAESHLEALMPGVLNALQDKGSNSGLKIEALTFLSLAMAKSDKLAFQPYIGGLSKPVFAAVGERYYKVTSEALRVCEQMVHILQSGSDQSVVAPLYDAVMVRLGAQDQDQEVKDCAIICMAAAISQLGDKLSSQMPQVLQVLLERLRNEITRVAAVKAFCTIASSPLNLDLSCVLPQVLAELTSFLRKANRTLRLASLEAMMSMVKSQGQHLGEEQLGPLIEEAANLVEDSDLNLAALSLRMYCTLLTAQPAAASMVCSKVLPQAMKLVQSPLLQGVGLAALRDFFAALVATGSPGASCGDLQQPLLAAVSAESSSKAAQSSVAQCFAVLTLAAGQDEVAKTLNNLLASLQGDGHAALKRVSLLILGEIGRKTDLAAFGNLQSSINASLSSSVDDIKSAASTALGGITVGSLQTYLPFLLEQIGAHQASPKHQYLLLKSLNEVISSIIKSVSLQGGQGLGQAEQEHVLKLLLSNSGSEEECRNVVAECAGRLAFLNPSFVLPQLQGLIDSNSATMRWLVVTAVRHTVVEKPNPSDEILVASLPIFLERIGDQDRHVRRAAVLTLSTVAHNKPSLIVGKLPELLPMLYQQTIVDENLIRTVDLGPFKHKIDDGLELRKAAFECMDMILDQCVSCLDFGVFLEHLEGGLKDHYDVKMPCHSMLAKLAAISGQTVLMSLEKLVEPLEKTLTVKLKSDAVKQEVDRNEDMLRSCLRAIDALTQIPAVESCPRFTTFMKDVVMGGTIAPKYTAVKEERQEGEVNSSTTDCMTT